MKRWLPALWGVAFFSQAATVPALTSTPSNALSLFGQEQGLTANEREGVQLAQKWINGKTQPITAPDGAVVYYYGASLPSVVCSPLKTCDIQLEAGEQLVKTGINTGDSVRWKITPTLSGSGDNAVTHIIVKPSDVGLETSLMLTTNRRSYMFKLVSRQSDWMPVVRFDYPDTINTALSSLYAKRTSAQAEKQLGNGLNIDNLDFNYRVDGQAAFTPVRVYNNSIKTILEMPRSVATGKLPSLLVVNAGRRELINYRYNKGKFIVDGLPKEIVLVIGAGKYQQSVLIKHKG